MNRVLLIGSLAFAAILSASGLDLSSYKQLPRSGSGENLVKNPSFLEGKKHWVMAPEYDIGPYGPNAVPAVRQKRNGKRVGTAVHQKLSLKPNTTYRYGAMMYHENLKRRRSSGAVIDGKACVTVSWIKNGNWVWGTMTLNQNGVSHGVKGKWSRIEYEFTTPDKEGFEYRIYPIISANAFSGMASWTNIFLEEARAHCSFGMIHPKMFALTDGSDHVEVALSIKGEFKYPRIRKAVLHCVAEIVSAAGRKLRSLDSAVAGERALFNVGKLPYGEYTLELKLVDTANKYILDTGTLPLRVLDPAKRPANAMTLDRYGRAIRNGKPFLPVGTYTWAFREEDLKDVHEAGFNFIMAWGPLYNYNPKFKQHGIEATRAALDLAHKYKLGVMMNLLLGSRPKSWSGLSDVDAVRDAVIKNYKDHPAIMAWYVASEPAPQYIKELNQRRQKFNALDPWHPTFACCNIPTELAKYYGVADILAVDPYPIRDKVHNQEIVIEQVRLLRKFTGNRQGSGAFWMVPQMFSWSLFTKHFKLTKTPEYEARCAKAVDVPTEREMLSMALAGAIHGVKGFLFYEYQHHKAPGIRKRTWKGICNMVRVLKEQSDLILGYREAPAVQVKIRKGQVYAKAFLGDNGAKGIFITSVGPGESEAEIRLTDYNGLKSLTGNCRETAPGVYLFKGKDIDCDILR